jgi:D-alanyl-D-alanine carboxypeptidase/D-alanyl-D-alanine-endopeptidase (penicillin-binding protein 4)
MKSSILAIICAAVLFSCSPGSKIRKAAERYIIKDSAFNNSHIGIAVYDPEKSRYLFGFQDEKYFIPASTAKIFTCYAGMKFLGDSLAGLYYVELDTALIIYPTGDPTFLHKDYMHHPVAAFLAKQNKPIYIDATAWDEEALGAGWSWGDYSYYYMVERSALPVYGNLIRWYQVKSRKENPSTPSDTVDTFIYSDPELDSPVSFGKPGNVFSVLRDKDRNAFTIHEGRENLAETAVPFVTAGISTALTLLRDTIHQEIIPLTKRFISPGVPSVIRSQPVDSMLKPMMHRSDNFFAEQTLLMTGYELTGKFNVESAVEAITASVLGGLPHPPRWADGSGLSRYDLFTPRDMVWVLDRMKTEFPWARISSIFATGGKGTLRAYVADSGRLYAKTGTLSGVLALSGYVITRKNKTLIFSILVNNHRQPVAMLRNKLAAFLHELIEKN